MNSARNNRRAVFVGCVRDCAPYLPAVFENLARMRPVFSEVAYVFVTNDSSDDTQAQLDEFARGRPNVTIINMDGLADVIVARTVRLAICRNRYVEHVRQHYADFDLMVTMDLDDMGTEVFPEAVAAALDFLDIDPRIAGASANQLGTYYDTWALRHPRQCPDDPWEALGDYVVAHGVTDREAWKIVYEPRMLTLAPDAPPMEVVSAFGGLTIYKMSYVLANRRRYVGAKVKNWFGRDEGMQICEHVSFNEGILEAGGHLYILPFLINRAFTGLTYDPAGWKILTFPMTAAVPLD